MNFLKLRDLLRISFRQVLRQRRRYLGVFISIAIGTAGVIIILTMGKIVKGNLNDDLDLIGGATILSAFFDETTEDQSAISRVQWFLPESLSGLRKIPGVALVGASAMLSRPARTLIGEEVFPFPLLGVDSFFWGITGHAPAFGKYFTEKQVRERQQVCVLGARLAERILGEKDVVGKRFSINNAFYTVVGVLSAETSGSLARNAYIPITTMKDRLTMIPKSNKLLIRCATWDDVENVAAMVPKVVKARQSIERLVVDVPHGALTQVKRIVFWVQTFIYFSIVATLTLGGYGIWNGMMTAVKARTREIGLKKAMGAEDRDIMFEFLTEAISLSVCAGIFGIILGRVGVEYVSQLMHTRPPESLVIMFSGMSLIFSLALGIIAGYYPSLRASKMEVVTAIRYE